jgi:5-methylcytosine-specific restriction endonuclease McrA
MCDEEKPIGDFYRGQSCCKVCDRARHKRYYWANLEKARARRRAHWHTTEREAARARYAVDPAVRQRVAVKVHHRRARLIEARVVPYTATQLAQRMEMSNGVCGLCRLPLGGDVHRDHIKPLAQGGADMLCNIQAAHAMCNQSKGKRWEGPSRRALFS